MVKKTSKPSFKEAEGQSSSERFIMRYYVLDDNEPVQVEFYDNDPKHPIAKSSKVWRFKDDKWDLEIDNDYINVGTEEKFKKNEVTIRAYNKAVGAYKRRENPSKDPLLTTTSPT